MEHWETENIPESWGIQSRAARRTRAWGRAPQGRSPRLYSMQEPGRAPRGRSQAALHAIGHDVRRRSLWRIHPDQLQNYISRFEIRANESAPRSHRFWMSSLPTPVRMLMAEPCTGSTSGASASPPPPPGRFCFFPRAFAADAQSAL